MKKLKKFQKFALTAKQASSVKGGDRENGIYEVECHYVLSSGKMISIGFYNAENAVGACNSSCIGCF